MADDSHADPAPGHLLIAPPAMQDPNFRRSVVLLCDHDYNGSFGLILNQPTTYDLRGLFEDLDADQLVYTGGPVEPTTLHFVHRCGDLIEGALPVTGDIFWGGNFEQVRALIQSDDPAVADLRFFLGYAGWAPGQLDNEIALGGWILQPARADHVFEAAPAQLWRSVMRSLGGEYALLSNYPDDPRMN